jgi:S1-C subfamily serine protease
MKASRTFLAVTLGVRLMTVQQTAPTLDNPAIFARSKRASVIIVAGEGAGRLHATATEVLVSPDGVVLTARHTMKNATEVQVRLANGEVFGNCGSSKCHR